ISNVVCVPGSAVTAMCPPPPCKTRERLVWDVSCNPNPPGPKSASACSRASRGVRGVVTWYRIGAPLLARPLGAHEAGTCLRLWRRRSAPGGHGGLAPCRLSPHARGKMRASRPARHDTLYSLRHITMHVFSLVNRQGFADLLTGRGA